MKRSHRNGSSPHSKDEQNKRYYTSASQNPPIDSASKQNHHDQSQQKTGKCPTFASYLETPNLPPKIKLLCEVVANTHSLQVEKVLDDTGVRVSQEDVEEVLKLSYGFPASAVKFFRWAGHQLKDHHSPYAWNLVVDMLGKNGLFDAMWDAIKSMRKEGLLSLATFASVFSSYVVADRVQEAIMTFEVMDQYGCARDIVALNSLLSAICREAKTAKAVDFLHIAKDKIRPDADTYAILLEGWENEGDADGARKTFAEMVVDIGWDPGNVPAYDSYLNTLLKAPDVGLREALKVFDTVKDRRCLPGMKFLKAALEECLKMGDARGAGSLWQAMMGRNGCRPDTQLYNSMIAMHCYINDMDMARKLLDEMVYNGAFPDSKTYNLVFQFFIKTRKLHDAWVIFNEMIKNECVLSQANCHAAVRIYMDIGDPYMAIKVWKFMIENYKSDLEEIGNFLVVGLRDANRVPEAVKYAEDMIDRGIKLNSSTLTKLKQSLCRVGKAFAYEELLRKWKTHSIG
ncbi:pentatricopeptide repeat-containing protein At1g77360, mitochondrial-like [Malania oleifera]|uniref:pentatricopeptide repeat-containing protein At1g77360, mitochondrial-like n=1 Tax=Malania oleifera TaxID=397392 RepID=UPI0025AE246A|nr:pentatricopeptide repeat-containing protein At1g77360, mitochondrial-like [Malania oleifera]